MEAAAIQRRDPTQSQDELRSGGAWKPADPGPLGLGAFAMTTFVLSMFNSNLVNGKGVPVVLGVPALAAVATVVLLAAATSRAEDSAGAIKVATAPVPAPLAASARAVAAPRPDAPPVTSAAWPRTFMQPPRERRTRARRPRHSESRTPQLQR